MKKFSFTLLLLQSFAILCWAQIDDADDLAFLEALRQHELAQTQQDFADEFREKIGQDHDGNLIKAIAADSEISSMIFFHLDAVPDKFVEIVLAEWLEDEKQWGSRGGLKKSLAGPFEHWLRNYFRSNVSSDLEPHFALQFVLENDQVRQKLALILRQYSFEQNLSPEERVERRSDAWEKIVAIVHDDFPRLMEEDQKLRAEAAIQEKNNPKEKLEIKGTKGDEVDSSVVMHATNFFKADRWLWFLPIILIILVFGGYFLRNYI